MKLNTKFSLFPEDYVPPVIRLEIKLKPYPHPPSKKTPVLVGHVTFNKLNLQNIAQVMGDSPSVTLRVALWDAKDGVEVEGVIEYREFENTKKVEQETKTENNIWY